MGRACGWCGVCVKLCDGERVIVDDDDSLISLPHHDKTNRANFHALSPTCDHDGSTEAGRALWVEACPGRATQIAFDVGWSRTKVSFQNGPSQVNPHTKPPPPHMSTGTKTFKSLVAIFLILPFLIVVIHFRPGKPHGAVTRSAYSGAASEETSWAASWPCIQGLPHGTLQDVYGIGDRKEALDLLVYQRPVPLHSTITSSSSSPSSFMRFILALVRALKQGYIYDDRNTNDTF